MSKESNTLNVIEVDAEEMPLEEKIEKSLIKANVTDKVINALIDKYSSLKLDSVDNKDQYLEIKEARKVVRKVGILTENLCKKGRESAVKEQRLWLAKEREILDKIDKVQLPLESEIKKFDDEVARKENEEKERREKAFQQRQATLIKYGAQYNNGSLELNHISYEIDNIRDSDEEIWQSIILPKYKAEFEKAEAERVRIEKEREEAALKLKQEQEELLKQQQEIDRQKKELADMQAEMQKQKDEAEREKRRIEQERQDKLMKELRERYERRHKQLFSLGMEFNAQHGAYILGDVNVDNTEMNILEDKEWNELIEKITPVIEERKKAILEKQIAETEAKKQADIEAVLQAERDRVAKEKADAELKEALEKQKQQEELDQANDKKRWQWFIEKIQGIEFIEMKNSTYKKKMAMAQEKISEIISL